MQGGCARTSRPRRRRNGRFPIVGNLPFLYCRDNCRLCPECVSFFGRRVRHSMTTPSAPNTEKVYHADCSNSIVYRQFLRKNFSTYRKMMEINCVSHPKRHSFTVFKPSNAPSKKRFPRARGTARQNAPKSSYCKGKAHRPKRACTGRLAASRREHRSQTFQSNGKIRRKQGSEKGAESPDKSGSKRLKNTGLA